MVGFLLPRTYSVQSVIIILATPYQFFFFFTTLGGGGLPLPLPDPCLTLYTGNPVKFADSKGRTLVKAQPVVLRTSQSKSQTVWGSILQGSDFVGMRS